MKWKAFHSSEPWWSSRDSSVVKLGPESSQRNSEQLSEDLLYMCFLVFLRYQSCYVALWEFLHNHLSPGITFLSLTAGQQWALLNLLSSHSLTHWALWCGSTLSWRLSEGSGVGEGKEEASYSFLKEASGGENCLHMWSKSSHPLA